MNPGFTSDGPSGNGQDGIARVKPIQAAGKMGYGTKAVGDLVVAALA